MSEPRMLRVSLNLKDRVNSVRPSVDVTFKTAVATIDDPIIRTTLTEMGEDCAEEIRAIKQAGRTFAQYEETSVVYGTPQRDMETGCINELLLVDRLPEAVLEAFTEVH